MVVWIAATHFRKTAEIQNALLQENNASAARGGVRHSVDSEPAANYLGDCRNGSAPVANGPSPYLSESALSSSDSLALIL